MEKVLSLSRPVFSGPYPSEEETEQVNETDIPELKKGLAQLNILKKYVEFKIAEKDFDLTKRAVEIINDSITEVLLKKRKCDK